MTEESIRLSRNYNEALFALIANQEQDPSEVIELLTDADGKFVIDEGVMHDYKDEYPFSTSDNYFAGILRLICAFHNSHGGIIIFGVHDKNRLGGKNRVDIDTEKVNRRLREDLSGPLQIRKMSADTLHGRVDLMIIPPREAMSPPLYLIRRIGDYKPKTIYLRSGAEVLTAKGHDLSFLYSDRSSAFSESALVDSSVPSSLPPSPATIQEFVGRFAVIERVINWITSSRDPRLFLWGQGGSGKSTIAYECATLLAEAGRQIKNKKGHSLDRVLYISGKVTYLDPNTGKIQNTLSQDFDDARDIYRAILLLSDWASAAEIDAYSSDDLVQALEELFDIEAQFIVIDDIDTLTTSKKDAGMEELLIALSRSQSGSKVLYTQRGFASFAANASVEVPGLTDDEFKQFLPLCCQKFGVPTPSEAEESKIKEYSESRPLAVETIVGMRRITSSYTDAFRRWKENSAEARRYLFNREYEQLGGDDRGRYLLAALAIFDAPQTVDTLRSVLQFSPEQLDDAISETRDMFLTVTPSSGIGGDFFAIGAATRLFIQEASKELDRYASIEARVQLFKSSAKTTPASFVPIIDRAARSVRMGNSVDAISLLTKSDLPSAFKEHTEVQALLGQAYATLNPPNVTDARKCFDAAYSLGHRDYEMYLSWLDMEKANRTEIVNGIAICSKVVTTSGFNPKTKATFLTRLARYQALKANDLELSSLQESGRLRRESVLNNIRAFTLAPPKGESHAATQREKVKDYISINLRRSLRSDDVDEFFDLVEAMLSLKQPLDSFIGTVESRVREFILRPSVNVKSLAARANKMNAKMKQIDSSVLSVENVRLLSDALKTVISSINNDKGRGG